MEPVRERDRLLRVAAAGSRREVLAFAVLPGENTAGERAPREHGETLLAAQRQQLTLDVARDQRVLGLERDEPVPAPPGGEPERLGELPRRVVARARITDLALVDEVVERRQGLFERSARVPAMDLVQVDPFRPEAAQRRLDAHADMAA